MGVERAEGIRRGFRSPGERRDFSIASPTRVKAPSGPNRRPLHRTRIDELGLKGLDVAEIRLLVGLEETPVGTREGGRT